MASLNKVFLMGNLTRDPEKREVGAGGVVCKMGLAVNRRYTTQGEDREETCFVDIETWDKQAEACARVLKRGAPVLVEGRLQQDRWEDRETGAARSRLLVRADRVQFLSGPARGDDDRPHPQQPEARPEAVETPAPEMPEFEPIETPDDDIPF